MSKQRWIGVVVFVSILALLSIFEAAYPGELGGFLIDLSERLAINETRAAPQIDTLFEDDFEDGITRVWNLDSNWEIDNESRGDVLDGVHHAWASLLIGSNWTDYTYSVDVKRISGSVQLNFRMSDDRGRYILGLHQGGMYLRRESPWGNISADLATGGPGFDTETWYTIHIDVSQRWITVTADNGAQIIFQDNLGTTLWQGSIGLEVTGGEFAHAQFDNVHIEGVVSPNLDWVKTGGPIGGLGYDVRYGSADKSIMYVTDNYSGVNKSIDGGETWFTSNRGITSRTGSSLDAISVFTLTVDPNNPDIVWAGLKDAKGLYKSTNAGQTWENVTPNIPDPEFVFRGVTVQPGNSNFVYAQGELPTANIGKSFNKVLGRIYYSEDGGVTWTEITQNTTLNNLVRYVIIHPNDPNTIYASLGIFDREAYDSDCTQEPPDQGTGGILKGVRSGSTWNWTFHDVVDASDNLADSNVGSLVMHPTNPNILLAGAGNVACSPYQDGGVVHYTGGVFRSQDGGQTWTKTLSNEIITSVEFSASNPNIAYAAGQHHYYRSGDGGFTWNVRDGQDFPWGPPGVIAGFPIDILVDPDDPNTMFVNNYGGGNIKSIDGGANWTLASKGYTGALLFDVSIDPNNPIQVYAAARSGVFRSLNGGSNWQGLAYPPAAVAEAYSVAVNPENPNVVIVARDKLGTIFRSEDRGSTWSLVLQLDGDEVVPGDPLKQHSFKRIEFAPSDTDIVYGGVCRDLVRVDQGYTDSLGIYRSLDGGKTWHEANDATSENHCIHDLAIHPDFPGVVYAATAAGGVIKTLDGGQHWTQLTGLVPTDIRTVALDPNAPGTVYVGAKFAGLYRYFEGSGTWQPMMNGMDPNESIYAIVFDPVTPDVIWAGSYQTGVYRWDSVEGLWIHVNDGLRTRAVTDLDISADGQVLYASTWGEGVFRLGDISEYLPDSVYLPGLWK